MNPHSTAGSPTPAPWSRAPRCSSRSTTRRHAPISSLTSRNYADCRRLRSRTALFDRLLQHLAELHRVLVTVNTHCMLHGYFDEFFFAVGGYCDRAFAFRGNFPAIDIFPGHRCLLGREAQDCALKV